MRRNQGHRAWLRDFAPHLKVEGSSPSRRTLGIWLAAVSSLIWWIVVTLGVAGIVGACFHLFDGPAIAREIGFTRGDGGFQTEVGFADLALGVVAVLAIWFRDRFL